MRGINRRLEDLHLIETSPLDSSGNGASLFRRQFRRVDDTIPRHDSRHFHREGSVTGTDVRHGRPCSEFQQTTDAFGLSRP